MVSKFILVFSGIWRGVSLCSKIKLTLVSVKLKLQNEIQETKKRISAKKGKETKKGKKGGEKNTVRREIYTVLNMACKHFKV